MKIKIAKLGRQQAVEYAVSELMRVLAIMDPDTVIELGAYCDGETPEKDVITVGLSDSVAFDSLDDMIKIDVENGVGTITCSNERSVLIAVYRLLRELGCRWLRPGTDGEFIPKRVLDGAALTVHISEKPSYRHRAVCYEGSNGYESIKNLIEWLPRNGMNGYFMQGVEEDSADLARRRAFTDEVKKRGLVYHAVGHGFTAECLGLHLGLNDKDSPLLTPDVKQYFAMLDGKREMHVRVADTQLCYSNPKVVELINGYAVNYLKKHPDIEYVHYWLGDGCHNYCECEDCKKKRPADHFIDLLNDLDERLKAEGIDTKVVFLIYSNLLWAAEKSRLKDPARFTMMFAPITRKYTYAFCDRHLENAEPLGDYIGNGIVLPKSLSANAESLADWQKIFDGDSFVFDYHLMWDHMLDPGYMNCAFVLHRDMANLDRLGLNGMVSCQVQRAAFPTGLPQYAMAAALWNKDITFDEVCGDYFTTAFGDDGKAVRAYLERISELFDSAFMRNDRPEAIPTASQRALAIKETVAEFRATHLKKMADASADWRYLALHAGVCERYASLIYAYAAEDEAEREAAAEELERYSNSIAAECRHVLDVDNFNGVFKRWIIRAFRLHTRPYEAY